MSAPPEGEAPREAPAQSAAPEEAPAASPGARLGALLPPWLYWPAALVACSALARGYRFRLSPLRLPAFVLQDLAVGLAFALALALFARRARPRDQLVAPALGFALLLWLALLGMVVTGLLALPVGVKLLLQAPALIFLKTAINAGSVQSSVLKLALVAAGAPLLALAGALWLRPGWSPGPSPRPWLALCALPLLLAPWATWDPSYRDTHPAVTLLSTALQLGLHGDPPDPGISPERFQAEVATLSPATAPVSSRLAALRWDGSSQLDVLVVVLETGVAPVLDLGREDPRWLPTLRRLARRSLWGQRHLAPFPGSTKSIFSLLTSRYPYPDYRSLVRSRPDAPLTTLAQLLVARGYRTGAYASIAGDYDRMDTFLAAHGFQATGDIASLGLTPLSDPTFGSDRELYQAYRDWLAQSEAPSYFVLLPSNSHWPFFAPPEDRLFPGEGRLPRYKNALQHQDRLLGEHLDWLAASGRLERTIVVVVADHGSYFDLAGEAGAASPLGLIEHHVPLLIDHPRLRGGPGVELAAATAHVDLSPTLLAMLSDQPPPPEWQGRSLLDIVPRRLVFFYQDFAEGRLGATDGAWVWSWSREADTVERAPWPGPQPSGPPPPEAEARLRTFFAHQLATLERVR